MKFNTEKYSQQVKVASDKTINFFLIGFFFIGIVFSFYYNTWLIGLGVGGLSLAAFYLTKRLLPNSELYQYVLGAVFGIFTAQFIYQMHGLFEMHFFAFIGSAILITYRNWRLQIPLAIVVLVHHAIFGYLQFSGFTKIYFIQLEYMTLGTFIIHVLLAITIFYICGLWARNFKKAELSFIQESFKVGQLQESSAQKDVLIAMSENLRQSNIRLSNAKEELERIFNSVDQVLFSVDMKTRKLIQKSKKCEQIYGYTVCEFMADDKLWLKVIHKDDLPIAEEIERVLGEGKIANAEYRIIHKNKSVRWLEMKITPTINLDGELSRIDGVCNDITDRKQLENKLAEEKKQKQNQIAAAALTAQENERKFLGEELHDNINPTLAAASLYLDCVIKGHDESLGLMKQSKDFIRTAMEDIRTLSRKLVPPSLGEIGLRDAISDMTDNLKKASQLAFNFCWEGFDESHLSDKLKLTIYRILQEQLNNIHKHADAGNVFITLKNKEEIIELIIRDDGKGFDISHKRNGVGLHNIISRAELFDGRVIINSTPGNGCELIVNFHPKIEYAMNEYSVRA